MRLGLGYSIETFGAAPGGEGAAPSAYAAIGSGERAAR